MYKCILWTLILGIHPEERKEWKGNFEHASKYVWESFLEVYKTHVHVVTYLQGLRHHLETMCLRLAIELYTRAHDFIDISCLFGMWDRIWFRFEQQCLILIRTTMFDTYCANAVVYLMPTVCLSADGMCIGLPFLSIRHWALLSRYVNSAAHMLNELRMTLCCPDIMY
jgi:hypothetical protein